MRIYLDNCCLNRPFDDQTSPRIRAETEAKLEIQTRIASGAVELAWSYILDYENQASPFPERRQAIARWRSKATVDVGANREVLDLAIHLHSVGLKPKDALHLACAATAGCAYFLTTDDEILRKRRALSIIQVVDAVQFVNEAS